jgi:hypothetical protein
VALVVGSMVCIAAANAGATSQDLKTGYLLGATPWRQQIGLLIGVLVGALAGSMAIGLAFGIPGLILVTRENKKPRDSRNTALLVLGFILMALGVMFGLGFNAGGLVNSIKNEF